MGTYSGTLRDQNSAPISGAKIYIYNVSGVLDALTNPAGGAALANPLTSDQFGNYSFVAIDGSKTMDIFLGGVRAWKEIIQVGPLLTVTSANGQAVSTRALLAAIASPVSGQLADLTESTREGAFVFSTANLSAQVTADPTQLNYVAPASAPTGASGAWVRKVDATLRTPLAANRTFYVRTDGSNSNDGSANTAASAFLTVQYAIDWVYNRVDLAGFQVTIQVADGTYAAPARLYGRPAGLTGQAQPLRIIGNEATPGNVIFHPAADTAVELWHHAYLLLAGVKLRSTSSNGLYVTHGAILEHRNCVFGACGGETIIVSGAMAKAIGPVTVDGASTVFVHATKRGIVDFTGQTLTFTGAPAFSTYLWGLNDSTLNLDSGTIVGAVTGGVTVHVGATLNASSLTGSYLGGSAPVVESGGKIVIKDKLETKTFYVNTALGNDANDGFVNIAGRAFKTIQGAVNAIAKLEYDPLAWTADLDPSILIYVAAGTYAETVNLRDLHFVAGSIIGDEATPANIVVAGVTHGFSANGLSTKWHLRGMKVTAGAGSSALRAENGSQIQFRALDFGAAFVHIYVGAQSRITAGGNYSITGAASYHMFLRDGSISNIDSRTITITGTPAFTRFVYAEMCSVLRAPGAVFSGAATGTRYEVRTNGVLETNGGGATFFPGDVAGIASTGGQYV